MTPIPEPSRTAPPANVLVIAGSSRRDSLNGRLARLVAELRPAETTLLITDLTRLPFYDGDLEAEGTPPPVAQLRAEVRASDLLVFVTPEYNGSVPGLLANAVDWLSRPHRASELRDKPVLVLSASPSPGGGATAAAHLRAVLERTGADIHPAALSVPLAHRRLAGDDADAQLARDLADLLGDVLDTRTEDATGRTRGAA